MSREEALIELLRGRLSGVGPTTASALAEELGLRVGTVSAALIALETEGYALRGSFTPGRAPAGDGDSAPWEEWCERGLLARIHRYTIGRLRREIEPVHCDAFLHFLVDWHGLAGERDIEGPEGMMAAIARLEGFEVPAGAWEQEVLPVRAARYRRDWLDSLCLSGHVAWGRRSLPASRGEGRASGPARNTPITLLARERLDLWLSLAPRPVLAAGDDTDDDIDDAGAIRLSSETRAVYDALARDGASFFAALVQATGLLRTSVERSLGELVAAGLVTADSFAGMRALLRPASGSRGAAARRRRPRPVMGFGGDPLGRAGRWSLLRVVTAPDPDDGGDRRDQDDDAEQVARVLLRRYGVVFRGLLTRERNLPPWRLLLRALRRLEARGEIRGGRFVQGGRVGGEQYALPEAVGLLRRARRELREAAKQESDPSKTGTATELVRVSATDPVNLVGIIAPGERVPAVPGNRILIRGGEVVAVLQGGSVRHVGEPTPEQAWAHANALHRVPAAR